jgi:hypothetical protein
VTAGRELQEVQEESETSLADSQQSSCSQEDAEGAQPSPEGDVVHDWRKAEECHLTCNPPVCLGELVDPSLCHDDSQHKCEEKPAAELSSSPVLVDPFVRSAPESLHEQHEDAQNTSQTEDKYFVQTSEEDKTMHLPSDANLSDAVKVENRPALEESLSNCQENTSELPECLSVCCDSTLPDEDAGKPSVLQE